MKKRESKKTRKHTLVQEKNNLFKKKELAEENTLSTKKASKKLTKKKDYFLSFFLGWECVFLSEFFFSWTSVCFLVFLLNFFFSHKFPALPYHSCFILTIMDQTHLYERTPLSLNCWFFQWNHGFTKLNFSARSLHERSYIMIFNDLNDKEKKLMKSFPFLIWITLHASTKAFIPLKILLIW